MIDFIKIVETSLSLDFNVAIVILALISSIIFYAKDFRIGLLSSFILVSLAYLLLYQLHVDTSIALLVLLILVVLLSLSFYFTAQRSMNPFIR